MKQYFDEYTALLKRELIPALGCTEPISVAYASALSRDLLGAFPESMVVSCSPNVIKNARSVLVPMGGTLRGIEAAALMGAVGGDASLGMEVLSAADEAAAQRVTELLKAGICRLKRLETEETLAIRVEAFAAGRSSLVEIRGRHDRVVRAERDGTAVDERWQESYCSSGCDDPPLSLGQILEFAEKADLRSLEPVLNRQMESNLRIAQEGLSGQWGAQVGKTLLKHCGNDVRTQAIAYAAAGSDARMSGCVLPVVINSGSGNQGLTASLPVIKYAEYYHVPREKLLRSLIVSNLVAIYQKRMLGTLSAFCGAVCAATGSGAGIAYMLDGRPDVIEKTIVNTLANVSGIVCDGAKPSCAAKIASSVHAAILGFHMAQDQLAFQAGDGIVQKTADETCVAAMRIGRDGMRQTDRVVLDILLGQDSHGLPKAAV